MGNKEGEGRRIYQQSHLTKEVLQALRRQLSDKDGFLNAQASPFQNLGDPMATTMMVNIVGNHPSHEEPLPRSATGKPSRGKEPSG